MDIDVKNSTACRNSLDRSQNLDAIRERLAACCYCCHKFEGNGGVCDYCELDRYQHYHKADVAALLAEIDGRRKADN